MIGAGVVVLFVFGSGLLAGRTMRRDATGSFIPVVSPVHVAVPQAAAPVVTVNLPPPPEPAPAPEPAPLRPRALSPMIWADCVLPAKHTNEVCGWDNGFPAVSADGTRIATWQWADDVGRGYPGVAILLVDTKTSRVVDSLVLLSPEEYAPVAEADDGDGEAVEIEASLREKLTAKIARRAVGVQRQLRGYRSLRPLGSLKGGDEQPEGIHAEFSEENVRIIDPATGTALWQHDLAIAAPHALNVENDCGGWNFADVTLAWDPKTKVVVANSLYHYGGCMCGSATVDRVYRIGG